MTVMHSPCMAKAPHLLEFPGFLVNMCFNSVREDFQLQIGGNESLKDIWEAPHLLEFPGFLVNMCFNSVREDFQLQIGGNESLKDIWEAHQFRISTLTML